MPSILEMRERCAELVVDIRKLADLANETDEKGSKRGFDGDEEAKWDQVNKEHDELRAQIERDEKLEEHTKRAAALETQQAEIIGDQRIGRNAIPRNGFGTAGGSGTMPDDVARSLAFRSWLRGESAGELTAETRAACEQLNEGTRPGMITFHFASDDYVRSLQDIHASVHPSMFKQRAMSTIAAATGGVLIPETFIRNLEINQLAFGGVRQVAETIRTSSGERMSWPSFDDTDNTGVQLAESTTIGSSVEPATKVTQWDAYKFSSKALLVPRELLEDAAFDLPSRLGQMLGERLGRITNTKFTTGGGDSTPRGIVTASTAGNTTASATAITTDELIDLEHEIDPAYRAVGCGWMFKDATLKAIRKLKDGEGRYIWQSGMIAGAPDSLFGYPYTINQDMATIAASAKPILFGQFSKYKIRTVKSVLLRRLDERYADVDQVGFIAFIREDGNLLDAGTAPVKHLLMHA